MRSPIPTLTEFELLLLDTPADHFTVQLAGADSEAGVLAFIGEAPLGGVHGYYETRQGRNPWFVAVEGIYPGLGSGYGSAQPAGGVFSARMSPGFAASAMCTRKSPVPANAEDAELDPEKRPPAAGAGPRASRCHPGMDDAPGRALPARVPRHAPARRRLHEPVPESTTRL